MKLNINDSTDSAKSLYYQSLVLLYMPCEKFGEGDDENKLYVDAKVENGLNIVTVRLVVGDADISVHEESSVDTRVYSQMKNLIGRTFLNAAFKIFGYLPPWGISTGVKPVKLARIFVDKYGREEAERILREEYMILPQKAKMAVDACIFEEKLIAGLGDKPCSLYISIPFCPTKCNYCSFVSCTTPRLLSLIPDYLLALENDLTCISETVKELGLDLKSVYVGGGTPAILDTKQIDFLLSCVFNKFNIGNDCEFTFEAGRPDCITTEKLKVLSDYGIPRISINTQTTNDEVLKKIGRSHSYSDFVKAFENARKVGFKCINTDLIAGLPGEDLLSFFKSVKDVSYLSPENITVHSFTLKRSSNYRIDGEKNYSVSQFEALNMTEFATEYLIQNSYSPYYVYRQKNTTGNLENVGYSKCGFESIYNVVMMGEYHTVFGAGAGSVTKIVINNGDRVERLFSPKYPYEFLNKEKYSGFDSKRVLELIKKGDYIG